MKTFIFLSLLVLLMGNSFCTPTETESSPDQSAVTNDKSDQSNDDTFQEVKDLAAESDLQEDLNDPLQSEGTADISTTADATQDVDSQGFRITLTPGRSITLTLGGGVGGGAGGVTYTRWGKLSCRGGAQLVYQGYAAGGHYSHKGNGANYLCMPRDPRYLSTTSISAPSYLYGAEYESYNRIFARGGTHNYNVPCAVCHRTTKSSKIMLPGKHSCPSSWYREYYGYLMAERHSHNRNAQYECVDYYPDVIGSQRDTNGALFHFVGAQCNSDGLPCGRYINNRAITCAVCTK